MNTLPPEPSAHDRISASFMKVLMRYIRANTLLNGPGYKTKRGPNGTTLAIEQAHTYAPSAAVLPWSFSCTEKEDPENPGEKKRTGGWDNCRLQVGLDCNFYSSWKFGESENRIKGTHLTDDGHYYLRVNLSDGANPVAEIVLQGAEEKPLFDYERGIVSIFIGSVTAGKLDERTAMHMNPTVWKYL